MIGTVPKKRLKQFFYLFFISFICNVHASNAEIKWLENLIFDNGSLLQGITVETKKHGPNKQEKKDWTFIVYIAADNDLKNFAARNIKQMANIGSTESINIIVHLDIKLPKNKKVTRRYFVQKDKIIQLNEHDPLSQRMDSGDPETLISCCKWGIENYPAKHFALILWNHGTGIIDPEHARVINPAELFTFNPMINKLVLDRSIGFLDFVTVHEKERIQEQRGICWDDSTHNFLSNEKLAYALNTICTEYLDGGKFSIIGFDACLMSMIEVASIIKPFADIMVGSQEVELGTGWNYSNVLYPFAHETLTPEQFATHIITMYKKTYNTITDDYTQSAIALNNIDALEKNISIVSHLLLECIRHQKNTQIKNTIRFCRRNNCTHFDEPSYIDLDHFYANVLANMHKFVFRNQHEGQELQNKLKQALDDGRDIIREVVIANCAGKNLKKAAGISIYFPERRIHSSYGRTTFIKNNAWAQFLGEYLQPYKIFRETLLSELN